MGGRDKGLEVVGGRPLLAHVVERLRPQVDLMALNANGDPGRFAGFGLEVVADASQERPGPLAGVLAGMDWAAARGAERVVSVAWDTPFFPLDLVARLEGAAEEEETSFAMAMTPDPERGLARQPTFGLWDVGRREELRAALEEGVRKIVAFTEPRGCARVVFSAEPFNPFFNVNTSEDLAEAERLWDAHLAGAGA
jgi:molybdopterin-guanine dinucleotide biosynthesis protein A